MEQEYFTPEELALLRQQLKRGVAMAQAEMSKRGVTIHPSVVDRMVRHVQQEVPALREKLEQPAPPTSAADRE